MPPPGLPVALSQVKALRALAATGCVRHHAFAFDAHDIHILAELEGQIVAWGLDLQVCCAAPCCAALPTCVFQHLDSRLVSPCVPGRGIKICLWLRSC